MTWKGESRRHSLSRKGIKTNIDQHKRLSVRNYVARGKQGYFGTDIDLETSLGEYGFVMKKSDYHDYPDEYWVIYKMAHPNSYGSGYIRESELDALIQGKEWLDEEEIISMLDTFGITSKEEWFELPVEHKLSDIMGYWGYENIMGTDYYPNGMVWAYEKIGIDIDPEIHKKVTRYNDLKEKQRNDNLNYEMADELGVLEIESEFW